MDEITKVVTKLAEDKPVMPMRPPRDPNGYCHTHGYHVSTKHNSHTCKYKAPVHKDEETSEDPMGGSDKNKPTS